MASAEKHSADVLRAFGLTAAWLSDEFMHDVSRIGHLRAFNRWWQLAPPKSRPYGVAH